MKVKIVLEAEVEEEDLARMGMHNIRYILTDALAEFEGHRIGRRTVEQYVEERYASASVEFRAKKVSEVEARLKVGLAIRMGAYVAKVGFGE